ncbi:MAG: hypothetical protein ACRD2B_01235, partial [Terriglobia bacterium]
MTQVKWASAGKVLAVMALLILMGGWLQVGGTSSQQSAYKYPAPRWPSYVRAPKTVAEVMPYARALVRNKAGFEGLGMGVMKPGGTVAIVVPEGANPIIMAAIRRALLERKIKSAILHDYDLVGVSKQDAEALSNYEHAWTSEAGYMEVRFVWFRTWTDPNVPKEWLKAVRPDLYAKLFPPNHIMPASLRPAMKKLTRDNVGKALVAYLDKHPEITGVFWGQGGGTGLRRDMHPYESTFLGIFPYFDRWSVMTQVPSYPADVWMLSEEKTIEPIAFVDKLHVTSPQGTAINCNIPAEMSQRWARGVYQRGHLYMFPNQSDGRFPYSVVNYPSQQGTWDPRAPLALINGVIAGTSGEVGFNPLIKDYYKNGYLVKVEGGGTYGELLRTFLAKYPKINSLTFPFEGKPGFFYLYEIALGTNPKWFLDLDSMMHDSLGSERMRSGVFHFGLGMRLYHDPSGPVPSPAWLAFIKKYKLPGDHDFHLLNFFVTYQLHLRNTDKWVNLVYTGHLTSLDNPEVRALASRYGDPNKILAESYIPNMPGINAPGSFQEFASDPWKHYMETRSEILAGTYKYFYPRVAGRQVAANQ